MKYTFTNQKGEKELVKEEKWCWGIVYKDDAELHQFDSKGIFHQIKEIKWEDVKLFSMYKMENIKKRIDLVVSPEMQLFHFYRNIRPYYMDGFVKVYVFGYKIRGTSKAVYNFILPDDRVIIADQNNIDLAKFELNRSQNN